MNRLELTEQLYRKQSFLCVGLDTDPALIPSHLKQEEDPVFAFNQQIIDATREFAVSYKINTAFYEAQGVKGWESLAKTLAYLPADSFSIADAKRGDIGNTATQYAKTFFETYPFHSVTVAPYMGRDSVAPFLQFKGKWAIILGLTSNPGSADFQQLITGNEPLYRTVIRKCASWGDTGNTMFVAGATHGSQLADLRAILPEHFFLVPGVGTQGGDMAEVIKALRIEEGGMLINVSGAVIYADNTSYFAEAAHDAAKALQKQMAIYF